ncbi:hypothetical protein SCB49_00340 [unidentified eubacterium SCB49]|nr:hypothetical protein SCB49_00340 [unidentified eubacterium SCB49]
MISVTIIGYGNVGSHLVKAIYGSAYAKITQVYSRSAFSLPHTMDHIACINSFDDLAEADCYIIAVPDDHIKHVSAQLPFTDKLVVHTSGSVSMDVLDPKNRQGVFYPLQTFSKNKDVDFKEIPICIEAAQADDLELLNKLGASISEKVSKITSDERAKMHVAAVFVNNFVNHLYHISEEIMEEHNLDFSLLKPLIKETASKIETLSAKQAQTGPAKRNDLQTIKRHTNQLTDDTQKDIYSLLTKAIKETHTTNERKL